MADLSATAESRRVTRGFRAVASSLLFLGLLSQNSPLSGQKRPATLTGQVISVATGEPLRAAQLSLVGSDVSVTTEADGRFVLEELPAGIQFLQVAKPPLKPD